MSESRVPFFQADGAPGTGYEQKRSPPAVAPDVRNAVTRMQVWKGASGIVTIAVAALAGPGVVAAADPPVLSEQATLVAAVTG